MIDTRTVYKEYVNGHHIVLTEACSTLSDLREKSRVIHVYFDIEELKFIGTYSNNGWYGGYIPNSVKDACKSLLLLEEL